MIEPLHPGFAVSKAVAAPVTSLKTLINQLLRHQLAELMRNSNSSVMNEIPQDLCMGDNAGRITPVIEELLVSVISNARKGRIHIRAEKFRDIIILEIEDQSSYNGYALDFRIRSIEESARIAGGNISIKGQQQLVTSVYFSFPQNEMGFSYDC